MGWSIKKPLGNLGHEAEDLSKDIWNRNVRDPIVEAEKNLGENATAVGKKIKNTMKKAGKAAKEGIDIIAQLFGGGLGGGSGSSGDGGSGTVDEQIEKEKEQEKKDDPGPAPTPQAPRPTDTFGESDRRKRLRALRYGLLSTIRTSPAGLATQPDLLAPVAYGMTRSKLGQ